MIKYSDYDRKSLIKSNQMKDIVFNKNQKEITELKQAVRELADTVELLSKCDFAENIVINPYDECEEVLKNPTVQRILSEDSDEKQKA